MTDDLFLRRTVIGGQRARDDYLVIWHELPIGRIHKVPGIGGAQDWSWTCFLPNVPQRSHHRGNAHTLDQAKQLFRQAWDDLKSQISHEQIQQARVIENDRSRPWHKGD
ncbi:hypothetical protein QWJ07_31490 [Frankia sp. RB7]|nr:hypothetical protein [Frankia sp. RB7]